MPAGYAVMVLKPSTATLSLIGLIECPELEGAQHVAEGLHKKLVSADGTAVRQFPQRFSFRITASLRKIFIEGPDSSVDVAGDPQELLLNLKFRVRAYNGNVRIVGLRDQPRAIFRLLRLDRVFPV